MEAEKTDRRVRYTKALLKDALVELLKEYPMSKISVKALCEAADVNRSTFYAHYRDQYDLLRQVETEIIENLKTYLELRSDKGVPVTHQNLTGVLEYAKSNRDLFTALLSENSDLDFRNDIMALAQIVPFQYRTDERTMEYLMSFGVTGAISILYKWLKEGTQEPPEEMSELVLQALYNGLMSFR